jgi:hypothetical protein
VALQVGTGTTGMVGVEEISGKQIGVLVPTSMLACAYIFGLKEAYKCRRSLGSYWHC